jgi:hypothetical protein
MQGRRPPEISVKKNPEAAFFLEKITICPHKETMRRFLPLVLAALVLLGSPQTVPGQAEEKSLKLVQAVMCENIANGQPVNETVLFSENKEKAVCFTFFNPVPEKTHIYHRWYRRDRLSAKIRLRLDPPRWSTFSRIQFRDGDKGPWRVDITDAEGNILKTLRFSITE